MRILVTGGAGYIAGQAGGRCTGGSTWGAGGGGSRGAGGGAGGVLTATSLSAVGSREYTVTIGTGGNGGTSWRFS